MNLRDINCKNIKFVEIAVDSSHWPAFVITVDEHSCYATRNILIGHRPVIVNNPVLRTS
jgi:hypothetical protein